MVVLRERTKPLAALDLSGNASDFTTRFDDLIAKPSLPRQLTEKPFASIRTIQYRIEVRLDYGSPADIPVPV